MKLKLWMILAIAAVAVYLLKPGWQIPTAKGAPKPTQVPPQSAPVFN